MENRLLTRKNDTLVLFLSPEAKKTHEDNEYERESIEKVGNNTHFDSLTFLP